jgi:hypothetical protein
MVKKISTLALAALLAVPALAFAGAGGSAATTSDMQAQIDALSRQLEQMKAEMAKVKPAPAPAPAPVAVTDQSDRISALEDRAEAWDFSSRIKLGGDFRSRLDYVTAETPAHFQALDVARGVEWFTDPAALAPGSTNVHTVAGSQGSTFGSFGMLTGFFMQAGLPQADAAAAAGQTLGGIIYGDPTAIVNGAVVGTPTQQSQSAKTQALVGLMNNFTPAQRVAFFAGMGFNPTPEADYDNDTIWTNRLRLDMQVKALENVEFKGRLAMYKAWGMQNNPVDYSFNNGMGGGPFALGGFMADFDGATTRNPNDSILRVDRGFVNWNNIGGAPVWFSIGRRPTTDGPPAHLKLNSDERMATPAAVMDWAFDGISVGYAYGSFFGMDAAGRVRVCYGRGFESGPDTTSAPTLNDTDFAGVSWDVYKKGSRFLYLQSFGAFNVFNVPDNVKFVNPIEFAVWEDDKDAFNPLDPNEDLLLGRANLGNLYHTSGVYMDKIQNLNYFAAGAWSRTDVSGQVDEMGTSLLGSWWDEPENRDGYHFHAGVRYDLPTVPLKIGAEYNYGSKYWIAMTPGHDDLYASKLATRGSVYEIYGIYDIPGGEAISKLGKAWMRLGYQHYDYNYTGSGFWLGAPQDVDELANDPMFAQFYTPVKAMDQVYLTFEAAF